MKNSIIDEVLKCRGMEVTDLHVSVDGVPEHQIMIVQRRGISGQAGHFQHLGIVTVARVSLQIGPECAYIRQLFVQERSRKKGLGRLLVNHCLSLARASGCRTLGFELQGGNQNLGFYEKLGFKSYYQFTDGGRVMGIDLISKDLPVIRDLILALEFCRSTCEHAEGKDERENLSLSRGMSVGIRINASAKHLIDDYQRETFWADVKALPERVGLAPGELAFAGVREENQLQVEAVAAGWEEYCQGLSGFMKLPPWDDVPEKVKLAFFKACEVYGDELRGMNC